MISKNQNNTMVICVTDLTVQFFTVSVLLLWKRHCSKTAINEPPRGKTNNVVSEQVRHKPACTSTEKS